MVVHVGGFHSNKHHRRSVRLPGYDYSNPGAYFVTLCLHGRECLLGDVVDGQMVLSEMGRIAQQMWDRLPSRFPGIETDAFVIMPNHVHGIIVITAVGAIHESPLRRDESPQQRRKMLLPKIVGYFKMNTAKRANAIRSMPGSPFWQRNYYEHVVRDERELNTIRQYIYNNPKKWALDRDNPSNPSQRPMSAAADIYLREAGL
jgi:REP element-mobilizing transposase RayT